MIRWSLLILMACGRCNSPLVVEETNQKVTCWGKMCNYWQAMEKTSCWSVALLPKLKAAFKSWKSELASLQRPTSTNSVQSSLDSTQQGFCRRSQNEHLIQNNGVPVAKAERIGPAHCFLGSVWGFAFTVTGWQDGNGRPALLLGSLMLYCSACQIQCAFKQTQALKNVTFLGMLLIIVVKLTDTV